MRSEPSSVYWDSVSAAFGRNGAHALWRSHSDRLNRALVQTWLANHKVQSILKTDTFDEAVGQGLYPLLQKHAEVVHGIDIAAEFVAQAGNRYPEFAVQQADVRDISFADNSIDIAVSNSTLDHFLTTNDIDTSLRELFRVLKPGGALVISLDNLQNPVIGIRNMLPCTLLKTLRMVPYFVGATLSRRGLVAALEQAGFAVVETRAIMHCPRVLAVHLAAILQRTASRKNQQRFLDWLNKFEALSNWPSRYFTGHFVAAYALKPEEKTTKIQPE